MPGYMPPSQTDEWSTPSWLFKRLNDEFNFDIDAAASGKNNKCPMYFSIGRMDALGPVPWSAAGWIAFLNPPHSLIAEFVQRAYMDSHVFGMTVVCLLPVKADTVWWHQYVMKASEVRFIRGRVKFIREDGKMGPATFASCIVVFKRCLTGECVPTFKSVDYPERLSS